MGKQVFTYGLAQVDELVTPVAAFCRLELEARIDVVDDPVDEVGPVAYVAVERIGGDVESLGKSAHRQGASLLEQHKRLADDLRPGQRATPTSPDRGVA